MSASARSRVFVALDVPDLPTALSLAERVGPEFSYKAGLELFTAVGPEIVRKLRRAQLFLDLKLHDIPATVARAVRAAGGLGVDLLTVHALGGRRMLEAAREAAEDCGVRLLAVTVLTSHDDAELAELALPEGRELAPRLARLALDAGLSGFVCSPLEVETVRGVVGPDAFVVTPGIRRAEGGGDDQRRVATPERAIRGGASALVVGRPIRDAADPRQVAEEIAADVADSM